MSIANRDLLPDSVCFGCGPANPNGLHIEVSREDDRVVGKFDPQSHMTGFPGIVHGGATYTAMDCLATWTAMLLRSEWPVIWILREGTVRYHKPAAPEQPISLAGFIEERTPEWQPIVVRTEARSPDGELLAEGAFRQIPLRPDRFKAVAGIEELPANWRAFLAHRE
jgi:acyl-coenzyme A thioesterase PaaI-like protein